MTPSTYRMVHDFHGNLISIYILTYLLKRFEVISKIFHGGENFLSAGFCYFKKVLYGVCFYLNFFCTNSYKRLTVNVTADVQFGLGTLMNITNLIMYLRRLLYEFALTFDCNCNCWRTIRACKFKLRLTSYFNMVPHNRRFWN